jgi:hypothetical protein
VSRKDRLPFDSESVLVTVVIARDPQHDLEAMRNYETSQLELRLKWPGMEGLFEPMHWTQDINPVTM